MLFSKTAESHRVLSQQFLDGKIQKKYWALVGGSFPEGEKIVDLPLFKLPGKKNKSIVDPKGKPSQTSLRLLKTNGEFSLVEAQPFTGRSHQIRVHLQSLGFPLMGDKVYGGPLSFSNVSLDGALLHASSISFKWPETVENQVTVQPSGTFLEMIEFLDFRI
jgi:23S rRNA-/tRNA-specific pseudouridylate synthase